VLIMLEKKLANAEGGLVLCSLSEHVRTVFEISGLATHFAITSSRREAVARLASDKRLSKVSALATKLLNRGEEGGRRPSKAEPAGRPETGSRLSSQVAQLLSRSEQGGPSDSSAKRRRPANPSSERKGKT
jgi:hypothetical protein